MILLRYELRVMIQNVELCPWRTNATESDLHKKLEDMLYKRPFKGLSLDFRNGDHCCLFCRFSDDMVTWDNNWSDHPHSARMRIIGGITDQIKAELMAYERQEFEHRELEL